MTSGANLKVVVFSGGRGSDVLSRELLRNPRVQLTVAINGYDDGASTGEVRRFLGDSLGPSDFRKNASRLATALQTCQPGLVKLLDLRLPDDATPALVNALAGRLTTSDRGSEFERSALLLLREMGVASAEVVQDRLRRFLDELNRSERGFVFADCSVGNLVFAGSHLFAHRRFNDAVADYCGLLGLPDGMVQNVTDGTNAYLVGIDHNNRLLRTEAEIVDGSSSRRIREIYLVDPPPSAEEAHRLATGQLKDLEGFLQSREKPVPANATLLARLSEADLIISAPGTQHSSLFPSYVVPGIGATIARNVKAIKLLITNIQQDTEIGDASAVDIIDRAVYYLREKGRRAIPAPCLVTHYLINDPDGTDSSVPYVPLGRLETLEDPRLVRIGHYEDGVTGRHDAAAVLTPFVTSLLNRGKRPNVAVLLLETTSINLVTQTILEMLRGGIEDVPASVTVLHAGREPVDEDFTRSLPFAVEHVGTDGFDRALAEERFDYFVLFESSGMYRGDDIVNVTALITPGTLDAVWGSRRLSLSDIRESYRLRYRQNVLLGAVSYVGSQLLSLAYLVLYGRYISDTLSGVRAVRASHMRAAPVELGHKAVNHHLLSRLLRARAGVFETPVQFFSMSPARARRTTVLDGLGALATIVRHKLEPGPSATVATDREQGRGIDARDPGPRSRPSAPRVV